MSGAKHGPNRLSKYLDIHNTVMQQFIDEGFVLADELILSDLGDGQFLLEGCIRCQAQLRIDVSKRLSIAGHRNGELLVQTTGYSYSAILGGHGSVFRYDSPHADHNQYHHVHRYGILDGDVHGIVSPVPTDDWPTLGQVMRELGDWYHANITRVRAIPPVS